MGGTQLWSETHPAVNISQGFYSVKLGSQSTLDLNFNQTYWLSIEVSNDGEMSPRTKLTSTTFSQRSLYAEQSGGNFKITGGNLNLNGNWLSGDGTSKGLFVDSGGNVGIGTTSPVELLTLAGNNKIKFTGASPQNQPAEIYTQSDHLYITAGLGGGKKIYIGNGNVNVYSEIKVTNEDIDFFTGGAEQVTIDNDGNVGIGTTSPGAELDVHGDITKTGSVSFVEDYNETHELIYTSSESGEVVVEWTDSSFVPCSVDSCSNPKEGAYIEFPSI